MSSLFRVKTRELKVYLDIFHSGQFCRISKKLNVGFDRSGQVCS